jgi:tetratricopeptide (TPR) repeat protein
MADRYTYLPSLGPFLIAGLCTAWIATKIREMLGLYEHRFFAIAVLILGVPLSYLTVQQIRVWHDSVSLWDQVLKKEPHVHLAAVNRGIAYLKRGQLDKALEDFNRVILLRHDAKAFYHRALVFTKLNLLPQAIADYSSAIAVNPSFYDAYNNRGLLFERQGLYDKALEDFNTVISLRPAYFQAYVNRGLVFDRGGRYEDALADFGRAITLNPGNPDAYYNRGLLLFTQLGKFDDALADFDRAIALHPGDPDAYYDRGRLFERMGAPDRALADFTMTISLNPSYYQAYYERASILRKAGQFDKAERDLRIWKEHSTKR